MTEVQKTKKKTTKEQIKEIENGLAKLLEKAVALEPSRRGYFQQKAIQSFTKSIRGLMGCELGELMNAFEMNDKEFKVEPDEKLRQEIDDMARRD